ncbi:hypothetical protein MKX01_029789 [Papaver californicum]|nr:hypothetical protein MKX01_029789 [Papaver californicum]
MVIQDKNHHSVGGETKSKKKKKKIEIGGTLSILRTPPPLRKIRTKKVRVQRKVEEEREEECSTTPTNKEARLPKRIECPPAPRKKTQSSSSRLGNLNVEDFFTPPDLDSVFICHLQSAK